MYKYIFSVVYLGTPSGLGLNFRFIRLILCTMGWVHSNAAELCPQVLHWEGREAHFFCVCCAFQETHACCILLLTCRYPLSIPKKVSNTTLKYMHCKNYYFPNFIPLFQISNSIPGIWKTLRIQNCNNTKH